MQMRDRISDFLEEKQGLSANSKQSYKYDLEQFLDIVGERISETSLKIYMEQGRVLLSYGSVGGVGKTVLQTARLIQSDTL